jgi:hypothetical protein
VRPTFQDFGVQGFMVFITKHSTYNNSRIAKKKGTNISDFGGFQGFQMPNNNTQQLPILKGERMWDQHFGISGFGVSRFQMPNNNTQQLPNSER